MSEYLVVIEHEGESWGPTAPTSQALAWSATRKTKWSS
jgi:hypothetical protein